MKIPRKTFNGTLALLSLVCVVGAFADFYHGGVFLILATVFMLAQIYVIYRSRKTG